jgi:hypothetical protein
MSALAILFLLAAAYAACFVIVWRVRRRPLRLVGPMAAALLVGLEAILVHALSAYSAVGPAGLLAGNAIIALSGLWVAWSHRGSLPRLPRFQREPDAAFVLVLAVGILVLISALAYRPNNVDSMVYHLARVVYWIENHSVDVYPTNIFQQVRFPPGSEYLFLVLQSVSGSDAFASLVQFFAWMLLAASAPALARLFGASRRLARMAGVLVAMAPMAVLQASSTQNDLLTALMTVAIVAAALPLRRPSRWRWPDLSLLVGSLAAGLLVKPTSVVAATPLLVWVGVKAIRCLRRKTAWREVALTLPAIALAGCMLGPPAAARVEAPDDSKVMQLFLYPAAGEYADRLRNSLRGYVRNLSLSLPVLERLASGTTQGCDRPHALCLELNAAFDEDNVGNAGAALVVLAALLVAAVRWRTLATRARLGVVSMVGAWLLFHGLFRDNVWITRLQLPLWSLAPACFGAFRGLGAPAIARRAASWLVMAALGAHGAAAAALNVRRPLAAKQIAQGRSAEAYYAVRPVWESARGQVFDLAAIHGSTLEHVARSRCRRLGLFVLSYAFDYPLAWRALQRGIEVRHVVGPDDWPCFVYSERGQPPDRSSGDRWLPTGLPYLYKAPGERTSDR